MDQTIFKKRLKLLLALVIVLILLWIGFIIYDNSTFRLVGTNPISSAVNTASPAFDINFSKNVSSSQLSLSSTPNIISSYRVIGKSIDITLITPLNSGTTYTLSVKNIYDTGGKQLANLQFTFDPKYVAPNQITQSQQNQVLEQQSSGATTQGPSYTGTGGLINNGVSTQQIQDYEQAIASFAQSKSLTLTLININQSSIIPEPLNTYSDGSFGINFSVTLNNNLTYNAKIHCVGLNQAELYLYDTSSGAQIFDSGLVGSA